MDHCESESDPTFISKIRVVGFDTAKWQVVPVKEVVDAFAYRKHGNEEVQIFQQTLCNSALGYGDKVFPDAPKSL